MVFDGADGELVCKDGGEFFSTTNVLKHLMNNNLFCSEKIKLI